MAVMWASIRTINVRARLGQMQPHVAEEDNSSNSSNLDDSDDEMNNEVD